MLNLRSDTLLSNGTNLHYYRTGSGTRPLVMAHGITDDSLCWSSVAEALADRYDIYMVDARGHGKSEAPEDGYQLENLARELAALIQGLGLEKPILLGHSMGAVTSLVLASLFPDLPRAILLEDAPPFWRHDPNDPKGIETRKALAAWIHAIKRKTKEELMAEAETKNWTAADRAFWVDAKQRVSLRVTGLITPSDILPLGLPNLIPNIQCPALFLQTDVAKGAVASSEDIAALRSLLPSLQVAYIPDASHSIRRTQFTLYMKAVEEFLSQLN